MIATLLLLLLQAPAAAPPAQPVDRAAAHQILNGILAEPAFKRARGVSPREHRAASA